MTTKHIENDYTISFYSSSMGEYTTTYPSSSISESVTSQYVTQSVLKNYIWTSATGSNYSEWAIISGTSEIAENNPNNSDDSISGGSHIGERIAIRNNQIFTNMYRVASGEENNGIVIYNSSSEGWDLSEYLNIPTSSTTTGDAQGLAREFSLDGDLMTVSALDNGNDNPKLYIYRTSSTGWEVEETLTTSSYNDGSPVADTDGENAYITAVVKGDTIFANGFYGGSGDRYVAFFKSSSIGGWAFEDNVQTKNSSTIGGTSDHNASLGISGLSMDFDGTTAIVGSKQADGAESYHNATGRLHIFSSSSAGWAQVAKLGLSDLGVTSSVTSTFGSTYGASEYRTWTRFAYKSCVVSGSYIAAAAQGEEINSVSSTYVRQRHSVFILKSGSGGWAIEARLNDPANNLNLGPGGQSTTSNTLFGDGLFLKDNVLVVNSPYWKPDWTDSEQPGRSYVYVSTSAGGWSLNQTIDNPYSGSVFQAYGASGLNMYMGSNERHASAGSAGYGAKPALDGNLLALGAPINYWLQDPSGSSTISGDVKANTIYGAIWPLVGSGNYEDEVTEEFITQSVTNTTYVTKEGSPLPFRFASKGVKNIRMQDSTGSYKTFIGEQKT